MKLYYKLFYKIFTFNNSVATFSFLDNNIEKLYDQEFLQIFQDWWRQFLENIDDRKKIVMAKKLEDICNHILRLSSGDRRKNIEIAIAGYNLVLPTIQIAEARLQLQSSEIFQKQSEKRLNKKEGVFFKRKIYNHKQSQKLSNIINNLGHAYQSLAETGVETENNLKNAISFYKKSETLTRKIGQQEKLFDTLHSLGSAYRSLAEMGVETESNLKLAIAFYRKSKRITRKLGLETELSDTLTYLGIAHQNLADIGVQSEINLKIAIAFYHKSKRITRKLGLETELSDTLATLGIAHQNLADIGVQSEINLKTAIAIYRKSKRIKRKLGREIELSDILANLGIAHQNLAYIGVKTETNLKIAIAFYEKSERLRDEFCCSLTESIHLELLLDSPQGREKLNLSKDRAGILYNRGLAYKSLAEIEVEVDNNISLAMESYKKGLRYLNSKYCPFQYARIKGRLGDIYYEQENWVKAVEHYQIAIEEIEKIRTTALSQKQQSKLLKRFFTIYENMIYACVKIERVNTALETVERSKSRYLVNLLDVQDSYPEDLEETIKERFKKLSQEIALATSLLATDNLIGKQKLKKLNSTSLLCTPEKLVSRQKEYEQLLNQISEQYPEFVLTKKPSTISAAAIQQMLDSDTVILEWYIGNHSFYTFLVTRDKLEVIHHDQEKLKSLQCWADNYIIEYQQNNKTWGMELDKKLKDLATILDIANIISRVRQRPQKLILIRHRYLNLFPLHALPLSEENQTHLIDWCQGEIKYVLSSQLLQKLIARKETNFNYNLYAIQNPTQDLPGSEIEVSAIEKLFSPYKYILKHQEANKDKFFSESNLTKIQQYSIIHFSCHGRFDFDSPSDSCLILASDSANHGSFHPKHNLTLREIYNQLKLNQSTLVTLSACETGLTESKDDLVDDYISFPSAFIYAGTDSVISTLWAVKDNSTSILMIRFYQEWIQSREHTTIAMALKQAQLWLKKVTVAELQEWINECIILTEQEKEEIFKKLDIHPSCSGFRTDYKRFEDAKYWGAFCYNGV